MKTKVIIAISVFTLFLNCTLKQEENAYKSEWKQLNAKVMQALRQGQYNEGIPFGEKAYKYALKHFGKSDPNTLTSMNNLASLYRAQGRYGEAEPLYREGLQLCEKTLGKKHKYTLSSMNNLAALYESQGRYGEAEPLYKETLQLRTKVLGKGHPDTLTSMNNLGLLYKSQGRYKEAEPLYKEVLQLFEKTLGQEHLYTLTSMNNLAELYRAQGRYGEAEPLYKEALDIGTKVLGKENSQVLKCMGNLGQLYQAEGRYGEAEPLYKQVLQLFEKTLGQEHPSTLTSMNNLASLYFSQEKYHKAEPLFKQVLQVSKKILGQDHPHTLGTQLNYIGLLVNMKKDQYAFGLLKQMGNHLFSRSFQELYTTSSESVRRLFLSNISNFQDTVFYFALNHDNQEYNKYAANVILGWKQIDAEETGFQNRLLHISNDPEIEEFKKQIKSLQKQLSKELNSKKPSRDIKTIITKLETARADLRKKARDYRSNIKASTANLDQVIATLPNKSAIIEFRMYYPKDFKTGKSGEPRFCAYLVLSDIEAEKQVFFADIGKVEDIVDIIDSKDDSDRLYLKLFAKFDKQIRSLNKLYIAPDSFLNLISFASLTLPDQKFLVQRQQINRLQTGRDLLDIQKDQTSNRLIAMGGIDYGKLATNGDEQENFALNKSIAREIKEIPYLKHSRKEAMIIAELFKANNKNGITDLYLDHNAKEHILKSITSPPKILHLSTHGFYLTSKDENNWLREEQPLLFSGLMLAGANQGRFGIIDDKGDDGILYSMEVLGLNLQGTELVSLSACETGQGVIDYSEGVYGLVRAFRIAGAKSVLMTLRSVSDLEAKDFMVKFYSIFLSSEEKISPADALHKTRLYYIDHPNLKYRSSDVWDPYVVIGI